MFHALVAGVALLAAAGDAASTLTLDQALAGMRSGLAEARLAAELAGLEVELAQTRGPWLEGPSLGSQIGWRRQPNDGNAADFGLDIELPLASAAARDSRAAAAATLEKSRDLLSRGAQRSDRQQVVDAYLALWGAQQRLARHRADSRLLGDFADLLRRQIEAGAVAPYQAGLAAAELAAAGGLEADAEAEERAAWARLLGLADLPPEPIPQLARPVFPAGGAPAGSRDGLPAAQLAAERELADARGRLARDRELSRSALGASLAKEGDEEVLLFGWRWRLPRAGEKEAIARRAERESALRAAESRQRQAELAARAARSRALIEELAAPAAADPSEAVWQAAELRVREGKDSPSEAMALRRALIAARLTATELELRRLAAQAELDYLDQETRP